MRAPSLLQTLTGIVPIAAAAGRVLGPASYAHTQALTLCHAGAFLAAAAAGAMAASPVVEQQQRKAWRYGSSGEGRFAGLSQVDGGVGGGAGERGGMVAARRGAADGGSFKTGVVVRVTVEREGGAGAADNGTAANLNGTAPAAGGIVNGTANCNGTAVVGGNGTFFNASGSAAAAALKRRVAFVNLPVRAHL